MKKTVFILGIAALFAACSKGGGGNGGEEPTPVPPVQETKIPIEISIGARTWGTDENYENGDKVGIYVVNYSDDVAGVLSGSGNHIDNMRFSYDGSQWTADQEIYWKDQTTKADFYCYYPYGAPSNVASYPFSVQNDQSSLSNYKASEFLWGKASAIAPSANTVPIVTNHTMSNILIYLNPGNGYTEESLAAAPKTVKVCNVKVGATINLATGVVTASGTAAEVTPYDEGGYYRALLVPQTVADGSDLIRITVDGVDYTLAQGFAFETNKQHKFTVAINKQNSGVNVGVGDWEVDGTDNGGSAE